MWSSFRFSFRESSQASSFPIKATRCGWQAVHCTTPGDAADIDRNVSKTSGSCAMLPSCSLWLCKQKFLEVVCKAAWEMLCEVYKSYQIEEVRVRQDYWWSLLGSNARLKPSLLHTSAERGEEGRWQWALSSWGRTQGVRTRHLASEQTEAELPSIQRTDWSRASINTAWLWNRETSPNKVALLRAQGTDFRGTWKSL